MPCSGVGFERPAVLLEAPDDGSEIVDDGRRGAMQRPQTAIEVDRLHRLGRRLGVGGKRVDLRLQRADPLRKIARRSRLLEPRQYERCNFSLARSWVIVSPTVAPPPLRREEVRRPVRPPRRRSRHELQQGGKHQRRRPAHASHGAAAHRSRRPGPARLMVIARRPRRSHLPKEWG
jgi:hypothetical protein